MPLRAISGEKNLHAFEFDEISWANLKASYRTANLQMPCCGNNGIPKTSKLGSFFFAHKIKGCCTTSPESTEHIYVKSLIARAAMSAGWTVSTEWPGETPEGERWIADVFCERGKSRVALEVQMSYQSNEAMLLRQARYQMSNVRCAWFLSLHAFKNLRLSRSKETPFFLLSAFEVGSEPKIVDFDIGIVDFVRGMLTGQLTWQKTQSEYQKTQSEYQIRYIQDTCWKCFRPVKQIYGYDIDVYGDVAKTVPNVSTVLEEILSCVSNEALKKAGLNIIGRFDKMNGKIVNYPYCNSCVHCGAPQNNYYLLKKLHEHIKQQADVLTAVVMGNGAESETRGSGSWVFTSTAL